MSSQISLNQFSDGGCSVCSKNFTNDKLSFCNQCENILSSQLSYYDRNGRVAHCKHSCSNKDTPSYTIDDSIPFTTSEIKSIFGDWSNFVSWSWKYVKWRRPVHFYKVMRKFTVERDDGKCRLCGDDNNIQVHHITPRKNIETVQQKHRLSNLITLCASCHSTHEGKYIELSHLEWENKIIESVTPSE